MSRTEHPTRPSLARVAGYTFGGTYVLGTWVYGTWYIWEHWAGYWGSGTLAWYGFMRAIVWPVWVVQPLL